MLPFTAGQFTKLGLEIDGERAPRNVGKTAREKAKKGDAGKKGGKRRQVGKKVNFEPDSAFRGEKKTKPKAAKKDAIKATNNSIAAAWTDGN